MHHSKRALIAHLKANEVPINIPSKYAYFADVFLSKLAADLLEHTGINNHTIKLVDDWPLLYVPIYSLGPVELKTLKA